MLLSTFKGTKVHTPLKKSYKRKEPLLPLPQGIGSSCTGGFGESDVFFLLCSVALTIAGLAGPTGSARNRFLNESGCQPGKPMKTTHHKEHLLRNLGQVWKAKGKISMRKSKVIQERDVLS